MDGVPFVVRYDLILNPNQTQRDAADDRGNDDDAEDKRSRRALSGQRETAGIGVAA